jgi:MFS family permease
MRATPLLSAMAGRARRGLRRAAIRAALALGGTLSALAAVGFATCALFEAWRAQYGAVIAALAVSGVYLVLAALLFLCLRLLGGEKPPAAAGPPPPPPPPAREDEAAKAARPTGAESEAAALAVGVEIAKTLTPLQLTIVAAISGFIAGRKL